MKYLLYWVKWFLLIVVLNRQLKAAVNRIDPLHLDLAAAQRRRQLFAPLLETREVRVNPLQILRDAGLVVTRKGTKIKIFLDRHPRVRILALGHLCQAAADDLMGFLIGNDLAIEFDGSVPNRK